ncbi:hypothetical protein [Halopiger goleimassiliensis]|uniref:hypothetical protein n=1 Tax=Halopiger goleimassiliensis TaxID=1293048 RepID=UPI000677D8E3|nr:hypothetical protein [Halopiger goleimassiliensis]
MDSSSSQSRSPTRTQREAQRSLHHRIATLEENQRTLERTLHGLAIETGVIVAGRCARCGKADMLGTDGMVHCPHCGNRHSL